MSKKTKRCTFKARIPSPEAEEKLRARCPWLTEASLFPLAGPERTLMGSCRVAWGARRQMG